eukprot:7283691-Karenia_brevis.AAC.1
MQTFALPITSDVEASDPISNAKVNFQEYEGTLPDQQRLFFAGSQLEDGSTRWNLCVQKESTFHVVPCLHEGLQIVVKTSFALLQRLTFAGKQLENGRTIFDCHIQNESTLQL